MNILLNFQAFHDEMLYNELLVLSKINNISNIYISSSLMHDLDSETKQRYENINKVILIKSTTLFNHKEFQDTQFNINMDILNEEKYLFTDLLSSLRWVPVLKKKATDMSSFSMQFYYDINNFWDNFFVKNNIDCVIQLNEEHSSLDSILLRMARMHNVKNIITSRVVGAVTSKNETYLAFYDNINCKYIKTFQTNNIISFSSSDNNLEFSDKYSVSILEKFNIFFNRFKYIVEANDTVNNKVLLLVSKMINMLKSKVLLFIQLLYVKKFINHYHKIAVNDIDISKKYIYYCLHFEAEASILPKDNAFSNQLLNIRILASSIPKDWKIYVKEHPHQLSINMYKTVGKNQLHSIENFRSCGFYNYINNLDNVTLVGFKSNHQKLMNNAQFVASNSGTVFREASYVKKQCLTFSKKTFYSLVDNVHLVSDTVSCKEIINKYKNINESVGKFNVDEIFNDYSIVITDIKYTHGYLLKYINKNNLYRLNND